VEVVGPVKEEYMRSIGAMLMLWLTFSAATRPWEVAAQGIPSCDDFQFQGQAQAVFEDSVSDRAELDEDGDGIACPDLPSAGPKPAMPDLPPNGDYDCADFAYQEMAQSILDDDPADPDNLDPNQDGFACALLPPRPATSSGEVDGVGPAETRAPRRSAQGGQQTRGRIARSTDPGSRDDPLLIGTAADIGGGWFVSVVDINFDATDVILAENMFNEPPEPGTQYVLITISATYEGSDASAVLLAGNAFNLVGESNVAYQTFDPACGVTPDDFPMTEVFAGGTLTGTVCFAADAEDVSSLVMYSEEVLSFDSDRRVWFALR
jgi:hypothetical protein